MDATSIELPGSRLAWVRVEGDRVRVRFEPAYLVKSMTGSAERTRWWQDGELVFDAARLLAPAPPLPAVCAGGDVSENVYTYRDMVPVPLESRGRASCRLHLEAVDGEIRIEAGAVRLDLDGVAKYIEHLKS